MKKVIRILTCLVMCFSFSGCFSKVFNRSASNNLDSTGLAAVGDINSLVSNVETMMKKVNAVSGTYTLTNTKGTYVIEYNALTKDKKIDWDLSAKAKLNDKNVDIYAKNQKLYIIYPHNGANVILKDDIKNVVVEAKDTLERLNATYDRENFSSIVMENKLEGFNFENLKEKATYVKNADNTYTLTFTEDELVWEYDVSSNYLITEMRCVAANFNSKLVVNYPKELTINYPKGLDFLTLDIDDTKDVLEVESFAELIDEDLKNK